MPWAGRGALGYMLDEHGQLGVCKVSVKYECLPGASYKLLYGVNQLCFIDCTIWIVLEIWNLAFILLLMNNVLPN